MTVDQIQDTKLAIKILRDALERCTHYYKYGIPLDASVPLWNAANFLWRQLPKEARE